MLLIGVGPERKTRWERGRPRGRPLLFPEGQRGYQVAVVSVSWADRAAIIERQRQGVMLAFGNQEEKIR